MKKGALKIIQWVDSCSSSRWNSPKDIRETPANCSTVGWIIHSTKVAVTLAQSVDNESGDVNATMTIPRGCIKSIRNLK